MPTLPTQFRPPDFIWIFLIMSPQTLHEIKSSLYIHNMFFKFSLTFIHNTFSHFTFFDIFQHGTTHYYLTFWKWQKKKSIFALLLFVSLDSQMTFFMGSLGAQTCKRRDGQYLRLNGLALVCTLICSLSLFSCTNPWHCHRYVSAAHDISYRVGGSKF